MYIIITCAPLSFFCTSQKWYPLPLTKIEPKIKERKSITNFEEKILTILMTGRPRCFFTEATMYTYRKSGNFRRQNIFVGPLSAEN